MTSPRTIRTHPAAPVAVPLRPAKRSHAELQALAARGSALLGEASADQVVAWVAENFRPDAAAVACSMADAVLPHLVAEQLPGVDVLFLDTGYHFAETYETRDAVAASLDVTIVDVLPLLTVPEQDAEYGAELFGRDANACCAMRKVEPLQRSLKDYELWFTGVRRDEAPTRANTPLVVWDDRNGLVKVNPVAAWSYDEILAYAAENEVVLNPLLDQGYPSIGCAPCTKGVAEGDDPRSGRWATLEKTECGLHL
ncbi:phosphoadenylyl-sulfate reductase [Cryobacterium melibiosiphilum]|uniref:Adenosine 5'-phosphosulfate reductase n=1 Tax=Cryobacterium melibiosiphilum TaxID=995039 RepID=A0A3A5MA31_9MICO|nr:phosphoadenylyl-sulfate reductase [Cryobacterium melibiosiphilum]RJT84693.1 phosphoadenylyl-sulfate reductase [Cryobacterium melibiosiphilum]